MKKFFKEFKEFALKGNMIDLAIGMIIATAFNAMVKSLVDDVMMPMLGILIGGHDISSLTFGLGTAQIKYGSLLQTCINFVIIALSLFVMVKVMNKLKRSKPAEEEAPAEPVKSEEVLLLEEIRDALVYNHKN